MSELLPLTAAEIETMAADWYKKLDIHAPLEEYREMLATEDLKMVFPEATVEGWEGFKGWYEKVINIFFDEVHKLKQVDSTINGTEAEVKVIVQWEASIWNPPEAYSKRIVLDAYQTWTVIRDPQTSKPVVLTYIVDELKYHEGSAKL